MILTGPRLLGSDADRLLAVGQRADLVHLSAGLHARHTRAAGEDG